MTRRVCTLLLIVLALSLAVPLDQGIAHGKPPSAGDGKQSSAADATGTCNNTYRSTTGTTQVTVCPAVVESGHTLRFDVHSLPREPVQATVQYPNGATDRQVGATDDQGLATLFAVIRYNPLYRYGQAQFQVTVGQPDGTADAVSGTVRIAQANSSASARLRVKPSAAKDWCPDNGRCMVRDNSSVIIRVDAAPNVQVQIILAYPNGETVPSPGNSLTGGTGFTDSTGAYICKLPVYFGQKKLKNNTSVLVQATISEGDTTIPLQHSLWLKGS